MGRKKAFDDERLKELRSLIEAGFTNKELAKWFDVHVSTIRKYIVCEFPDLKEKRQYFINSNGRCPEQSKKDMMIYAVYKKDKLINIGTIDDIAKQRCVTRKSVQYLMTPTHLRRTSEDAARIKCIEDDITRAIAVSEKVIKKIIKHHSHRSGQVLGYYDEEHQEYCICDNSEGLCEIMFYENKVDMLKEGYLLERIEDYEL